MNRRQRKQAKRIAVCLYDCNRAYGGPEEGGWWFDYGQLQEVVSVHFSNAGAWAAVRALDAHVERANEGKRPLYSVLCDGVTVAKLMPYPAPQHFPDRTPHYE